MSVPRTIHLARDLLDKQLLDRNGYHMGRCDGIEIVIDDAGKSQPRIAIIESGGAVMARRVHPTFERWFRALARRWGLRRGRPARVPWTKVKSVGINIKLEVDRERLPTFAPE